jgi:hypothetical protein
VTIGLDVQLDLAPRWSHAQGADQVQTRVVLQTRAKGRRSSARAPGPFER